MKLCNLAAVMAATTLAIHQRAIERLDDCCPTMVYFIQCNGEWGPIKIGRTGDVRQRLASIQMHNPYPLSVLCLIPGGDIMERAMHRRFSSHRLNGEWFSPSKELVGFLRDLNWLLADLRRSA